MRIGVLAPIAWRTPPRHYGPWELFASLLADGLVAAGHDVTLFATADSITTGDLRSTSPHGWNEDETIEPKVAEALHIAAAFEHAGDFDIIHNGFDFLPLTYSSLVRTPVVTESAVANNVTSWPSCTRPSVSSDANSSHGP